MDNKIDFKILKATVAIESVLCYYKVETRRRNATYIIADCPLPSHSSKESKGSFAVNTERNIWTCHSESCRAASGRKGGDVLDFVMLMEGVKTALDSAKKLIEWFPANGSGEKKHPSPSPAQPAPVAGENKPLAFALKGVSYCEYLNERGITEGTAATFGVGLFPGKGSMAGRLVIPILNQKGELVAYCGRSIDATEPRYKMPDGFRKTLVLYNLHRIGDLADTCILVEGFVSVWWLTQCGYPNVVGLMGSTLSEEQEGLLRFRKIILMLDGDEAGRTAVTEILPRLARCHYVTLASLADGEQPDTLTKEQIDEKLGSLL